MNRALKEILLSTAVVTAACSPNAAPKPVETGKPIATLPTTPKPTDIVIPSYPPLTAKEIDDATSYYQELKNTQPKETGLFKTDKGTVIRWLNYTNLRFNPDAAKTMFSFFQDKNGTPGIPQKGTFKGKEEEYQAMPRPSVKDKTVFLVNKDMQLPFAAGDTPGITLTEGPKGEGYLTIIRASGNPNDQQFSSDETGATIGLATEACDSTLMFESPNLELADLLQTQLCHSLGAMYASRQIGLSYGQYASHFRGMRFPRFEMLVFAESIYNSLPKTGPVLIGTKSN